MTEIPKRPETDDYPVASDLWFALRGYEHEVARVAVEALLTIDATFHGNPLRYLEAANKAVNVAGEALAKIEASGWKP